MKNNILFVGDMHTKKDNIDESNRLINFIIETALNNDAEVIFSGDQYNDHSIVHASVLDFWNNAYEKMAKNNIKTYSLIGNHDLSSDYKHSPMYIHKNYTGVILSPKMISNQIGAIGYVKNNDEFIAKCLELYNNGARLIFCHAEFDGASFDNGFFIPNGIKIDSFPSDLIFVSGHIHSRQELVSTLDSKVRVYYSGTPRMLTRSDLNKQKTIMLIDANNNMYKHIPVPSDVCEPFKYFLVSNNEDIEKIINSERSYVDVKGDKQFIESVLGKLPPLVKIRTIPDTEVLIKTNVSESDGINKAFLNYLKEYSESNKLDCNAFIADVYKYIPDWNQ